jgi:hypothetical protein
VRVGCGGLTTTGNVGLICTYICAEAANDMLKAISIKKNNLLNFFSIFVFLLIKKCSSGNKTLTINNRIKRDTCFITLFILYKVELN